MRIVEHRREDTAMGLRIEAVEKHARRHYTIDRGDSAALANPPHPILFLQLRYIQIGTPALQAGHCRDPPSLTVGYYNQNPCDLN